MSIESMDALLRRLLRRLGLKGYRGRCYYPGGWRQTTVGDLIVMPWFGGDPPSGWTVDEEAGAMWRIVQAGDVDWSDTECATVTPIYDGGSGG